MIQAITIKGEIFNRDKYEGDFDDLILDNLSKASITSYAEFSLDMVEEGNCECDQMTLEDFHIDDIKSKLKEEGYLIVKPTSIIHQEQIEESLEALKS